MTNLVLFAIQTGSTLQVHVDLWKEWWIPCYWWRLKLGKKWFVDIIASGKCYIPWVKALLTISFTMGEIKSCKNCSLAFARVQRTLLVQASVVGVIMLRLVDSIGLSSDWLAIERVNRRELDTVAAVNIMSNNAVRNEKSMMLAFEYLVFVA